jgi:hypothetical protein
MMKKLSHSVRKFICSEKARIRRQFWDIKKQEEMITDLYKNINGLPGAETAKPAPVKAKAKQAVKSSKNTKKKK